MHFENINISSGTAVIAATDILYAGRTAKDVILGEVGAVGEDLKGGGN